MPKAKIMIGCPGSGKSTYAKSLKNFVYISQDDQGVDHTHLFLNSVKKNLDVVIDRMGFNRSQRDRFTSVLQEAGYDIEYVELPIPKDLFERLKNRQNHPTVKDYQTAFKALSTFFLNYEPIENSSINNFYLKKLSDKHVYVFGDIHGSFDELKAFLNMINYNPAIHTLVFAGDLTDRGPKNKEVLEFVISTPNVHLAIGNHDYKLIRWLFQYLSGVEIKLKMTPDFLETVEAVKQIGPERVLNYLIRQSYLIEIGDNYIFHAGINPKYPIKKQHRENFLYCSTIDPTTGKLEPFEGKPQIHPRWFTFDFHESYKNKNLFFGHQILSNVDYSSQDVGVFALDSGLYATGTMRVASIIDKKLVCITTKKSEKPMWIKPYEELVNKGLLSQKESDDLVLFDYTEKCTYEREWNDITLNCRGTIFEKATGKMVAKTMPKFFNLNENGMTLETLPNLPYEVFDKLDGSMVTIYNSRGEWRTATRGSFTSDQAIKAKSLLHKYDLSLLSEDWTIITEVIYPENKIVVNYGDEEKLVMLALYNRVTGEELNSQEVAKIIGMEHAKKYFYTINELIKMKATIPKDVEGWVVKFSNGLRLKIKGDEYCIIHKIKSNMTPLTIWELMKEEKLTDEYKMTIPEELLPELNSLEQTIQDRYEEILDEIVEDSKVYRNWDAKTLGYHITKENGVLLKHPRCAFNVFNLNHKGVHKYIFDLIRPKGNVL